MKTLKKWCLALALSMSLCVLAPSFVPFGMPMQMVEAASKGKLNKTKIILVKGQSYQLKLSGVKGKIKWSSSKKSTVSVSSNGKISAKKKGTATITAKADSKKYTCKVTVEEPSLSAKSCTLKVGSKKTLRLKGTKQKVSWSSSKKSVATVSTKGVVTAKKAGTANITAKVGGKKYTCKVTVKKKSPTLSVSDSILNINETGAVKVTYRGSGTIYYHIEDTDIVSCSWKDGWDGYVTTLMVTGKKTGKTTVTITNTEDDSTAKITVNVDLSAKGIKMSTPTAGVELGEAITLSAEVFPDYASGEKIEWYSDNEKVASVSEHGVVTGESEGQAKITAMTGDGKYTAVCVVTVTSPIVIKLPETPVAISSYTYRGLVDKMCKITDIQYTVEKRYDGTYNVELSLAGEKLYDRDGAYISSYCKIGHKLYLNGAVVESGTMYSTDVAMGERFVDCNKKYYGLRKGVYELKLLDVK